MDTSEQPFWVKITVWCGVPLAMFGYGIYALIEGHPIWGILLTVTGIGGIFYMTSHAMESNRRYFIVFETMLALTWLFFGYMVWLNYNQAEKTIPCKDYSAYIDYFARYGVFHDNPDLGLVANVYGEPLQPFKDKFCCVVVVAYLYDGKEDWKDVHLYEKSSLHDIEDGIIGIIIPWDERFKAQLREGGSNTTYELLLVPRSLTPDRFNTLREAENLGAKILQHRVGPP